MANDAPQGRNLAKKIALNYYKKLILNTFVLVYLKSDKNIFYTGNI